MKDKIKDIQKEADILSKFNHKNIVKYYDSYLYKGKFYILMEYCEGETLKDFINKSLKNYKFIEENKLCYIIRQICEGIKEIHDKNIIHRDIKPENIFINDKMEIKIGDFGISKQFNPNKEYTKTLNSTGTIEYVAPEILTQKIYNNKSDMYSLGCIIYELLNLKRYFDDNLMHEIKKIDSNYSDKWQEIINSLLQSDFNKRMDTNQVCDIIFKIIYKEYKSIIMGEIFINKANRNEDIQIINSFENWKRELNALEDKDDYKQENEKEIKENMVIKINKKIIEFTYYYKFKKEGKYIIEYLFKNNLTNTNHMFCDCYSLKSLNLSNFKTQYITNMRGMFDGCIALTNLNLSNFNTENVNDINYIFFGCESLKKENVKTADHRIIYYFK